MNDSDKSSNQKANSLSEKEIKLFKKWLKGHLAYGPVTIVFTKKDGSEREMNCTTNSNLVPSVEIKESTESKKEKKTNEEVMPVYDLDIKGWRSFRWDTIKQVRFEL